MELVSQVGEMEEEYEFRNCELDRKGYLSIMSFEVSGQPQPRYELVERGSAAAVLPADFLRRELYMVEQPRFVKGFVNSPRGREALLTAMKDGADRESFMVAGSAVNSFELPAGVIDNGESPLDTVCRELAEETGLIVTKEHCSFVASVYPSVGGSTEILYCYIANLPDPVVFATPRGDGTERLRTWKMSFKEAFGLLDRGHFEHSATSILMRQLKIMELEKVLYR